MFFFNYFVQFVVEKHMCNSSNTFSGHFHTVWNQILFLLVAFSRCFCLLLLRLFHRRERLFLQSRGFVACFGCHPLKLFGFCKLKLLFGSVFFSRGIIRIDYVNIGGVVKQACLNTFRQVSNDGRWVITIMVDVVDDAVWFLSWLLQFRAQVESNI